MEIQADDQTIEVEAGLLTLGPSRFLMVLLEGEPMALIRVRSQEQANTQLFSYLTSTLPERDSKQMKQTGTVQYYDRSAVLNVGALNQGPFVSNQKKGAI